MIFIVAVLLGAVVGAAIGWSFMHYVMTALLAHATRILEHQR